MEELIIKGLQPSESSLGEGEEVLEITIKWGLRVEKRQGLRPQWWNWPPSLFNPLVSVNPSWNGIYFELWVGDSLGEYWRSSVDVALGLSFCKQICPWKMSNWAHMLRLKPGPPFICLYISQMKTCILNSHLSNSAIFREAAEAGTWLCVLKQCINPHFTLGIIPRNIVNRFRMPNAQNK